MVSNGYDTVSLVPDTKDLYESTFKIGVTDDYVPEATVLVYTVTSSGEVIADSLDFEVTGVLDKKVQCMMFWGNGYCINI